MSMLNTKGVVKINLLKLEDGQILALSESVADDFGIRHENIVRDIEGLIKNKNPAITKMFQESSRGIIGKRHKGYFMNRDGFTLLAMSFTGSKAMQWKLKYIEAFNEMEAELGEEEKKDEMLMLDQIMAIIDLFSELNMGKEHIRNRIEEINHRFAAVRVIKNTPATEKITDSIVTQKTPKLLEVKKTTVGDGGASINIFGEKELAEKLGLPLRTIQTLRQFNGLPHFRAGRQIFYRMETVEKWISEKEEEMQACMQNF